MSTSLQGRPRGLSWIAGFLGIAVCFAFHAIARGQTCPDTLSGELGGGVPGVGGPVTHMTAWDPDGAGPLAEGVVVAGDFSVAGNVLADRIAFWNGLQWQSLGSPAGTITALANSQGSLTIATESVVSGQLQRQVWQWNGTSWSTLGAGRFNGTVKAVASYGGRVVAAGLFGSAPGQVATANIAEFDGTSWRPLGTGIAGLPSNALGVLSLTVYNDLLIVGGDFTGTGSVAPSITSRGLLAWNGTAWSGFGAGVASTAGTPIVRALSIAGNELVIGGDFTSVQGTAASNVAIWNGTAWRQPGDGLRSSGSGAKVIALGTLSGQIIAAGATATGSTSLSGAIARFDGTAWRGLGGNITSITAVASTAGRLYAGGSFANGANTPAMRVITYDGAAWSPMGTGTSGEVRAITSFQGQTIAGGTFRSIKGVPATRIARWDGSQWNQFGTGASSTVNALRVFNGNLIAGGSFISINGVPASRIASFDGTTWSALGDGFGGTIAALEVYQNQLIAAGSFSTADGSPATGIARWNGSTWQPLGQFPNGTVNALLVDGNVLYVGGSFVDDTRGISNVARFDGSTWTPIGQSLAPVTALEVHNGQVYAAGLFDSGTAAGNYELARWNGSAWVPVAGLGATGGTINALRSTGSRLLIGGRIPSLAGVTGASLMSLDAAGAFARVGLNNTVRTIALVNQVPVIGGDFASQMPTGTLIPPLGTGIAAFGPGVPAAINQSPISATACVGGTAVYSVVTTGSPILRYQWQWATKSGGTIGEWNTIFPGINAESPADLPAFFAGNGRPLESGIGPSITLTSSRGAITRSLAIRVIVSNDCRSVASTPADFLVCTADFDCSGSATLDDLFQFINAWSTQSPRTDVDGVPGVSIDDVFVFLNIWFAGC